MCLRNVILTKFYPQGAEAGLVGGRFSQIQDAIGEAQRLLCKASGGAVYRRVTVIVDDRAP